MATKALMPSRKSSVAAIAMIDSTESRVSQAVTRLARAIGLAALGTQDAAEARDEAELALARLGLAHIGWHTLFYAAAGEERPAAPANV